MRRTIAVLLCMLTCLPSAFARADASDAALTLLFTSDIHSNVQPHQTFAGGETAYLGGFARLKTAVDQNWTEGSTLLVDSGDFSMGTMYQVFSETDALELSLMSDIGYDAVALGNHDFEPGETLLGGALDTLFRRGYDGSVLCANLVASGAKNASAAPEENPLSAHGVRNYAVVERAGVRIGLFALMGYEAIHYTKTDTLAFADPIETAKAVVARLRDVEKVDLVVLLSHCGDIPGVFHEDEDIAKAVDGIDVIVSGHTHKALSEPIVAGNTLIVGAGTALNYLGRVTLRRDGDRWAMGSYDILPLDDSYADDPSVTAALEGYVSALAETYKARYGIEEDLNAPFAVSNYHFKSADEMCAVNECEDYPYARLIGDAYATAIRDLCGETVQVVAEPVGVIRNGLYAGQLSVTDLYNALSYGISPIDRSSGAPITLFYLNGAELYDLCELSISMSPSMGSLQVLFGGLRYTYGADRPILDRVYLVEVRDPDTGAYEPVARDGRTLYSVAASWTTMQNVALLSGQSMGLLRAVPKDKQGNPLETDAQWLDAILRCAAPDGETRELKEWYALYHLVEQMPTDENGLHVIPDSYSQPGGYLIRGEGGLVNFLRNPSKAGWCMLGALVLALALLFGAIRLATRIVRKRKARGNDPRTNRIGGARA